MKRLIPSRFPGKSTSFRKNTIIFSIVGRGYPIDPSVKDGITSKIGFDATKKGGDLSKFEKITVPADSIARARKALGLGK